MIFSTPASQVVNVGAGLCFNGLGAAKQDAAHRWISGKIKEFVEVIEQDGKSYTTGGVSALAPQQRAQLKNMFPGMLRYLDTLPKSQVCCSVFYCALRALSRDSRRVLCSTFWRVSLHHLFDCLDNQAQKARLAAGKVQRGMQGEVVTMIETDLGRRMKDKVYRPDKAVLVAETDGAGTVVPGSGRVMQDADGRNSEPFHIEDTDNRVAVSTGEVAGSFERVQGTRGVYFDSLNQRAVMQTCKPTAVTTRGHGASPSDTPLKSTAAPGTNTVAMKAGAGKKRVSKSDKQAAEDMRFVEMMTKVAQGYVLLL